MGIDQFLNVTYKHASASNMSAYLDAVDIQEPIKSKLMDLKSSVTLTKNGAAYSCKHANEIQDRVITFVPGEEYEDVGLDGRSRTCVSTIEGNKIITKVLNEHKSVITSEFGPTSLTVTLDAGGVQAQDIFEKV